MNKKGAEMTIGTIVTLIIIVLVIVVVVFSISGIPKWVEDWFPNFGEENEGIELEEPIEILENPEKVVLEFQDINYNCARNRGWMWSDGEGWIDVKSVEHYKFKELEGRNKEFVLSLQDKSCEDGLALLVKRNRENNEGNWWFNTVLIVRVGEKETKFKYNHILLRDINKFIIEVNQLVKNGVKI